MHALVLSAHPDRDSLTTSTANRISSGLEDAGWSVEVADLVAEGFDPRMTEEDLAVVRGLGSAPADVVREQERVERADALIIVHPAYWWSMPALLKGWIDRVFTFGWAFGTDSATALVDRAVHIVRLGGSSPRTYESHGYDRAIRTGVEHGIFEFAGGPVASSHLIHSAPEGIEERAAESVDAVVASVTGARASVSA